MSFFGSHASLNGINDGNSIPLPHQNKGPRNSRLLRGLIRELMMTIRIMRSTKHIRLLRQRLASSLNSLLRHTNTTKGYSGNVTRFSRSNFTNERVLNRSRLDRSLILRLYIRGTLKLCTNRPTTYNRCAINWGPRRTTFTTTMRRHVTTFTSPTPRLLRDL